MAICKKLYLFFLIFVLASCSDVVETELMGVTKVMVINASPDAGNIDFYLNDAKTEIAAIAYKNKSAYVDIGVGSKKADVKKSGGDEIILSQPIFFQPQRQYSLFISGKAAKDSVIYVATDDVLSLPSGNRAKIRFINLSPGAKSYSIINSDKILFSNATYRSASLFQEINAGTYDIKLRTGQSEENILSKSITLTSGKIYTLWLSGYDGVLSGNTALGLEMITNN